jgi:hypothetical protein
MVLPATLVAGERTHCLDAPLKAAQCDPLGAQIGAKPLHDMLRLHVATALDVQKQEVLVDPGVDADVGLGQQDDAGEAVGLELVHAFGEEMRAAADDGGPEHRPERLQKAEGLRVAQPEVGQELAMDQGKRIVRHVVMVPDPPVPACEVVQ